MKLIYDKTPLALFHGDSREVLKSLPDNFVDSVVTDPPYELGFMGKSWDASGIAYDVGLWREVLRVLKPGGHMLAFGATRTYHRMACAIEDAGFEIRDSLHWVYGTGFPKSMNVGEGRGTALKPAHEPIVMCRKPLIGTVAANLAAHGTGAINIDVSRIGDEVRFNPPSGNKPGGSSLNMSAGGMPSDAEGRTAQGRWPANILFDEDAAAELDAQSGTLKSGTRSARTDISHEPIVMCRKPLAKGMTVAANLAAHGTGAINIDVSRIDGGSRPLREVAELNPDIDYGGNSLAGRLDGTLKTSKAVGETTQGRWPANILFDEDAAAELDAQSIAGGMHSAGGAREKVVESTYEASSFDMSGARQMNRFGDSGGASRFFYVAKASRAERDAGLEHRNTHPTVKPVQLMRYLVKLVTPPDGVVLDPFAGSGTTLLAAQQEGFNAIGVELTADYLPIILGRLGLVSIPSNEAA